MFNSARLKLTGWYLIIIMAILVLFSGIIYKLLMSEFYRFERAQRYKFERRLVHDESDPSNLHIQIVPYNMTMNLELIEETRKRIIIMLITINSGILIISGMLSYVLAGRTLQPIKDMVSEQNRFISDASHEFRTPLTSLKSAFEVFLRDKRSTLKAAKNVISESVNEVDKLQELSASLLLLAQFERPNGNTKFEHFKLDTIVDKSIQKVKPKAQEKDIDIVYKKSRLMIEANKYGLTDLFVILLDNAIKYSPSESTVTIHVQENDNCFKVMVTDQGGGLDEKDIPHIFDRFYRADSARSKSKAEGYGLGLSIAKKIAEAHNGSVKVENTDGEGALFTVALPITHTTRIQKPSFFS